MIKYSDQFLQCRLRDENAALKQQLEKYAPKKEQSILNILVMFTLLFSRKQQENQQLEKSVATLERLEFRIT